MALDNLLSSISDLNAQYPSSITRGAFCSSGAVGLADLAGSAAGKKIGAWAGSAIGSAAGPCGAVLGYLIGSKTGPYVCTFLASAAAGWICEKLSSRASSDVIREPSLVYMITDNDSIGYFHNKLMVQIGSNRSRYVDITGTVDYDVMYDDIISYCREIGLYEPVFEDSLVKLAITNQIAQICEISRKYKGDPTNENFIEEQCTFLKHNCNLSDLDIRLYKEFEVELYERCSTLPDELLVDYSEDLGRLIEESDISDPIKDKLKRSADLTINSSLYWSENF